MKDIYIYETMDSWLEERPEATIKGTVKSINDNVIEIIDENGYTQLINLGRLFSIVY